MGHRSTTQTGVNEDFHLQLARTHITGHSIIHKFGRIAGAGTTAAVISVGGIYNTPAAANATTLRVKAGGNTNDTVAGSGARKIYLEGLDSTGSLVSDEIVTAGVDAGTASTQTFIRLFRAYVSETGTNAITPLTSTHADDIVIENGSGGTDWATIDATNYSSGQSEIGAYSVPLNHTAYITEIHFNVLSTQAADVWMVKRENFLMAVAPFDANRIQFRLNGESGETLVSPLSPLGPFNELTDITMLARSQASTTDINVEFTIILIKDS